MNRLFVLTLWFVAAAGIPCFAELSLPGIFSDHMVVQRDQPIPVWGTAEAGTKVSVALGDVKADIQADAEGKWQVRLDALPAGGPHELKVEQGGIAVTRKDVLVGEVWICSGQSNMAMTVARSKDFAEEKSNSDYPRVRMFKVAAHATAEIQTDCSGSWNPAGPETVGNFSATAWFFGRKLHEDLGVPIGLINTSWGGTDIASWTSRAAQESVPELAAKIATYEKAMESYSAEESKAKFERQLARWEETAAKAKADGKKPRRRPRIATDPAVNQNRPANLFNGMLHPLIPYGIRGAIWYQGERNSKTLEAGQLYATQLKLMIGDWRERWGQGDFPFITAQLPNFRAVQKLPVESTGWVAVRESELASLRLKNTGIAITTDVGEANDIHPKNKQEVGRRLALWALGTTYGKEMVYSGPLFSSIDLKSPRITKDGVAKLGSVTIRFGHVGEALKSSDGGKVRGFAVAGEDKVWHAANARIMDGMITVTSPKVEEPVAVRYAWAENPIGNLVNSVGLPASPFRTDNWDLADEKSQAGLAAPGKNRKRNQKKKQPSPVKKAA